MAGGPAPGSPQDADEVHGTGPAGGRCSLFSTWLFFAFLELHALHPGGEDTWMRWEDHPPPCASAATFLGPGGRSTPCPVPEQLVGSPTLSPCPPDPGLSLSLSVPNSSRNGPTLISAGTWPSKPNSPWVHVSTGGGLVPGHTHRGTDAGVRAQGRRAKNPGLGGDPALDLAPDPSCSPRAEDEATTATGQLVPGAHPVPREPVAGAAALGQGALAPGGLALRACPPQQASPHRPQGQCLRSSPRRDSSP